MSLARRLLATTALIAGAFPPLIYSSDPEPFELDSCTRSVPVDFLDAKRDLGFLRELQE